MCILDTAVSAMVATRPGLNPWVDRNEELFLEAMSGNRNYLCGAVSIISVGQSVLSLWDNQYYPFGAIRIISVGQSILYLWDNQYYLCGAISIISVGQSVLSLKGIFHPCRNTW